MTGTARTLFASLFFAAICSGEARARDLGIVVTWVGKEPFAELVGGKSLWNQNAVAGAMRRALGGRYYALVRKSVLRGPQTPVATNGKRLFAAWSCKAHDCGDNQISVFFDSAAGTAQACLRVLEGSGPVRDLWLAEGVARPLPRDACLAAGNDPFVLLKKFGEGNSK